MSAVSHHPARTSSLPSGRRSVGGRVRRRGVGTFFVSIAVNAALGIYAVVTPEFGDTQSKILATSLFVTGAILVALACEPAWERRLLGAIPYAGALLGAVAFALSTAAIWTEVDDDAYGRLVGSTFVAAAACTAASLLALAQLAPRHRWIASSTLVLLGVGATFLAVLPWLGDDPPEPYVRALGVVLVALAALAVSVPVLHWVDRATLGAVRSPDAIRHCPFCGEDVEGEPCATLTCAACAARFAVARR
jgi:hypothetical protein